MFAKDHEPADLAELMKVADVFVGLSKGNIVSKEMVTPWHLVQSFLR